jgi:signal transduction histidine kinase
MLPGARVPRHSVNRGPGSATAPVQQTVNLPARMMPSVDDFLMSATAAIATVPLWVPLTTAGAGLVTGLAAGLAAAIWTQRRTDRREDVRWQRERGERQDQWQREDSLRWLQDRQVAYARLVTSLDAWDVAASKAIAQRHTDALVGELREFDRAEWNELRQAARAARGLVELMAPESVRGPARMAVVRRDSLRMFYLTEEGADLDEMDAAWKETLKVTTALRDAMREDLGLAADEDSGPHNSN